MYVNSIIDKKKIRFQIMRPVLNRDFNKDVYTYMLASLKFSNDIL